MTYTENTLTAERVAFYEGETRGEVLAWLTSSNIGVIEGDEDDS